MFKLTGKKINIHILRLKFLLNWPYELSVGVIYQMKYLKQKVANLNQIYPKFTFT